MTNPSKLAMFRAAIHLTWIDGELGTSEREKLTNYINNNMHLTPDERKQLLAEIDHPTDVAQHWEQMTQEDRAHLINIAESLFWADGNYCENEKELYKKIFADHASTLDEAKLQAEMKQAVQVAKLRWVEEEKQMHEEMKRTKGLIPGTYYVEVLLQRLDKLLYS